MGWQEFARTVSKQVFDRARRCALVARPPQGELDDPPVEQGCTKLDPMLKPER